MEVQRIATEGKRIDRPRNEVRLWIEVEAVGNGCSLEGHVIAGEESDGADGFVRKSTRVEIYADRLAHVLERTRTDAHRSIWARAEESAANLIENWLRTRSPKERARFKAMPSAELRKALGESGCNHHPAQELVHLGYRTGLPPLESCKVLHPTSDKTIDARAFNALSPEAKREWLVDAPITQHNATQRANENLAQQIAAAIASGVAEARAPRKNG